MTDLWKVNALSLATTVGVAYVLCAIFDVLFPPFGLLAALAPASPWRISGSPSLSWQDLCRSLSPDFCSARSMDSHRISGARDCGEWISLSLSK